MNLPSDEEVKMRHERVRASRSFSKLRNVLGLGSKRVLDAGCGYGEYLARFGVGSVGVTTAPHEVLYGKKNGLTIIEGNVELIEKLSFERRFEAVWANNLFEHLLSPHAFLIHLKTVVEHDGKIILGVPVVPVIPSLMRLRFFRGVLASNHINFFTKKTLHLTAERAGWIVEDVRPFLFQSRLLDRIISPFAPHIYVVARTNTSFRYPEKKLKEWVSDPHYQKLLSIVEGTRS